MGKSSGIAVVAVKRVGGVEELKWDVCTDKAVS